MDINKLINEHGAEIAKQLQIASTQVYDKILWYIRLRGIKDLITDTLILITSGILIKHWLSFRKQAQKWIDKDSYNITERFVGYWIGIPSIIFALLLLQGWIVGSLSDDIIKIVSPQYWLIDQVISKVTGQ